jgi:hypothetical protein
MMCSHKNLFHHFAFQLHATFRVTTYRLTMTIAKQNPTHQREQPMSLFSLSTRDLGLPVRSTPQSRRDPKEQLAFLQSILEQALEIANDVDVFFLEGDRPSGNAEEENSRSQNQSD